MHDSSMTLMGYFVKEYLKVKSLNVLDVGSLDVNGCYKELFKDHYYLGLDMEEGPNVNVTSKDLYNYPLPCNFFDVIISGQTIEHVPNIYKWIREVQRMLKIGGLICIIGPNTWIEHRYPVDCWRIFPDGMRFLLEEVSKLEVIECKTVGNDTIGIAKKYRNI